MKVIKFQRFFLALLAIILDLVIIGLSYQLVFYFRHGYFLFPDSIHFNEYLSFFVISVLIIVLSFHINGVYKHRRAFFSLDEIKYVFNGLFNAFIVSLLLIFAGKAYIYSRAVVLSWYLLNLVLLSIFHFFYRRIEGLFYSMGFGIKNIAVIGTNETSRDIQKKLERFPSHGMHFVGFISIAPSKKYDAAILGDIKQINEIIRKYRISEIIFSDDRLNDIKRLEIIRSIQYDVNVIIASSLFEVISSELSITEIYGIPTLSVAPSPLKGFNYILKRLVDICAALCVIIVGAPFFIVIAILIKIDSKGPVFFGQLRVTKNNRIFKCLKFRSMVANAEEIKSKIKHLNEKTDGPIFKMKNDPRITKMGKFLRRWSIDEFPQFINVLTGDMSLVGPRPPIPREVEEYESWHLDRLSATQGITGLWQVSGRSELSFEEMVKLDLFYIEHWSLWLDIKIILKTIPAIFSQKGAY